MFCLSTGTIFLFGTPFALFLGFDPPFAYKLRYFANMHIDPKQTITALILAGGRGSRMGGQDKGLIEFTGQPLIAHILQAIKPQVAQIMVSANRNQTRYAEFGYPVLADPLDDYQGPLAGMQAGLEAIDTPLMLVLPCDGPFVDSHLAQRLLHGLDSAQADIAVAHDGTRLQPVHVLLRRELLPSLKAYLDQGDRKIDLWYAQHNWTKVDFSDHPEQFHNLNKPADRQKFNSPQVPHEN